MAHEKIKHLDDTNFEPSISEGVVLVDFYADWCGPCRAIAPVIDEIAGEMSDKMTVAKVDVDKAQSTSGSFGVHSIPTIIVFKDGKEVKRFVGLTTKGQILDNVKQHL